MTFRTLSAEIDAENIPKELAWQINKLFDVLALVEAASAINATTSSEPGDSVSRVLDVTQSHLIEIIDRLAACELASVKKS